jgi:hypothetical protein
MRVVLGLWVWLDGRPKRVSAIPSPTKDGLGCTRAFNEAADARTPSEGSSNNGDVVRCPRSGVVGILRGLLLLLLNRSVGALARRERLGWGQWCIDELGQLGLRALCGGNRDPLDKPTTSLRIGILLCRFRIQVISHHCRLTPGHAERTSSSQMK